MKAEVFIDTNILIYAASAKEKELDKQKVAFDLLNNQKIGLSTVILGEFYNAVTKKVQIKMLHDEALEWLTWFSRLPCYQLTPQNMVEAADIRKRHNLQYFDSTHIIAAKNMNIDTIYSEDYTHNQLYDGVRVINPFLTV